MSRTWKLSQSCPKVFVDRSFGARKPIGDIHPVSRGDVWAAEPSKLKLETQPSRFTNPLLQHQTGT